MISDLLTEDPGDDGIKDQQQDQIEDQMGQIGRAEEIRQRVQQKNLGCRKRKKNTHAQKRILDEAHQLNRTLL